MTAPGEAATGVELLVQSDVSLDHPNVSYSAWERWFGRSYQSFGNHVHFEDSRD